MAVKTNGTLLLDFEIRNKESEVARNSENTCFQCEYCQQQVAPLSNGSYRNHCPHCLYSKHVDLKPGDRRNICEGLMKPIGLVRHKKKGWQLKHACLLCGHIQMNKIAEDTVQPDCIDLMIKLM
ncbi:RNHCP domain-containing protein [Maritalea mobilis]|uniref:RNHCP domain-containing protein n=1 Tax=Maritalea mobilis TaxID=483324 RepID=A0A4R6VG80_9HYPH|nr:RNHCP domain-containing protein [Maritalea mobilis]TDQ61811.1 RNHCP domain-containing protein [Maritalea mobilis]